MSSRMHITTGLGVALLGLLAPHAAAQAVPYGSGCSGASGTVADLQLSGFPYEGLPLGPGTIGSTSRGLAVTYQVPPSSGNPIISSIEPLSAGAGDTITIRGTNFGTNPADLSIWIEGPDRLGLVPVTGSNDAVVARILPFADSEVAPGPVRRSPVTA